MRCQLWRRVCFLVVFLPPLPTLCLKHSRFSELPFLTRALAVDYMHYRESTLGRALEDSLRDMVDRKLITDEQKSQVPTCNVWRVPRNSHSRSAMGRRCASSTSA